MRGRARAAVAALVAALALSGAALPAAAQQPEGPAELPAVAYGRRCDGTPCGISVQDRDGAVRELTAGADRPVAPLRPGGRAAARAGVPNELVLRQAGLRWL